MEFEKKWALRDKKDSVLLELCDGYLGEYCYETDCLTLSQSAASVLGKERVLRQYLADLKVREHALWVDALSLLAGAEISVDKKASKPMFFPFADGISRWFNLTVKIITTEEGMPAYAVGKATPLHQPEREVNQRREDARRDGLTQLYNPAVSRQIISDNLRLRRKNDCGTFLVVAIRNLKEINEKFGNHAGDKALVKVAALLRLTFRTEDVIGRIGTNAFVVYMKNIASDEKAKDKKARLENATVEMTVGDRKNQIDLGVGVVLIEKMRSFESVLADAEEALEK